MKAVPVSKAVFVKSLAKWNRCYMKKPKSWQKIWYWWEKEKGDPKEQWFMNVATGQRNGSIEESVWFTAKDLDLRLDYAVRQGYEFYVNEDV